MKVNELAQNKYVLWAFNCSYYSAKIRSYLIKKQIEYVEINPSHPEYHEYVVPEVGHFTVPILQGPDGDLIADSIEIIEYFEELFPENKMIPENKVMAGLAWLIHNFSSERHFKTAMYDRWKTTDENRQFAVDEFHRSLETKAVREAKKEAENEETAGEMLAKMALEYINLLGIQDRSEELTGLYKVLNAHFIDYPYILGGRPSVADFGLIAIFFPHVARDPSSSFKLKLEAPALYRWVETMNRAPIVDPEVWHVAPEYFSEDELPETLLDVMRALVKYHGPELRTILTAFNAWLDADPERPSGSIISVDGGKANHQLLEVVDDDQGDPCTGVTLLDPLTLHLRLISLESEMSKSEIETYTNILRSVGAEDFANIVLKREIKRDNYAYVLV